MREYGIDKIWMKGTGEDRYHITNILGISMDAWDCIMSHSGLYTNDKKIKLQAWEKLLKVNVIFRKFQLRNEDGTQCRAYWFRFSVPDLQLKGRLSRDASYDPSSNDDNLTPTDQKSEMYLDKFYDNLERDGKLRSNLFCDVETIELMEEFKLLKTQVNFNDDSDAVDTVIHDVTATTSTSNVSEREAFLEMF